MATIFIDRIKAISQIPENDLNQWAICKDLSLIPLETIENHGGTAFKLKKWFHIKEKKQQLQSIEELHGAIDYAIAVFPETISFFFQNQKEGECLLRFCKYLRRKVEYVSRTIPYEYDPLLTKIEQLAHTLLIHLPLNTSTEISSFTHFKNAWVSEINLLGKEQEFFEKQIRWILKEMKPINDLDSLKICLHQLQLISLLHPKKIPVSLRLEIRKWSGEVAKAICHFDLLPEEWKDILYQICTYDRQLLPFKILFGFQSYMSERLYSLTTVSDRYSLENELSKAQRLYFAFKDLLFAPIKVRFLQYKYELLPLFLPYFSTYLPQEYIFLEKLFNAMEDFIPLEELEWDFKHLKSNSFFIEEHGEIQLHPVWEFLLSRLSENPKKFLLKVLIHCLNHPSSATLAVRWLKSQDFNTSSNRFLLCHLFFKVDCKTLYSLGNILDQLMLMHGKSFEAIAAFFQKKTQEISSHKKKDIEDLLQRLHLLLQWAQKTKQNPWIEETHRLLALALPAYLQYATDFPDFFYLSIDDESLAKILSQIDLKQDTHSPLTIDLRHFPELKTKAIDLLLDRFPALEILGAFNSKRVSDICIQNSNKKEAFFYAHSRLLKTCDYFKCLISGEYRESLEINQSKQEIENDPFILEMPPELFDFLDFWLPIQYAPSHFEEKTESLSLKKIVEMLSCSLFLQQRQMTVKLDDLLYQRLSGLSPRKRYFTILFLLPNTHYKKTDDSPVLTNSPDSPRKRKSPSDSNHYLSLKEQMDFVMNKLRGTRSHQLLEQSLQKARIKNTSTNS